MLGRCLLVPTLAVAILLGASACGSASNIGGDPGGGRLQVVASFYPLQWVTAQVAGREASVTSLTKPGAEPHDLELTPRDVATVADADLVVYLRGFQPAVDDAVTQEAGDRGLDVANAADLSLTYTPIEEGQHEPVRLPCRLLLSSGGWRHAEEDRYAAEGALGAHGA